MTKSRRLRKAERRLFSIVFQDIFNWLAVRASAKQTISGMVIVFSKHKGSEATDKVAAALQ
jgi:ABC-type microcin C transport system duplicated ATPase subunit YejF